MILLELGLVATDDPFAAFSGAGRQLAILCALVCFAVAAFWIGRRQLKGGESLLRPRGRPFFETRRQRSGEFKAQVAKLETHDPTPAAQAKRGVVRVVGTITKASEVLGGAEGRECVWRNRVGAPAHSAVAADVVMVADDSGRVGVENLEHAFVIAPTEKLTIHHEHVSLYVGDRVEVFGTFEPEAQPEGDGSPAGGYRHADAQASLVYGTLGARGSLEVRLVERPAEEDTT